MMSGVAVMMWQPQASAWTTLSTSRGLAQSSSAFGSGFRIAATDSVISGTGSTPVSAMRPANTETMVRARRIGGLRDHLDLLERQDRRDVEREAFAESLRMSGAADSPLVLVIGILT